MDHLTSLQNPRIRNAVKLHTSRGRKQQQRIIVFGEREIARAVEAAVQLDSVYFHQDAVSAASIVKLRANLDPAVCFSLAPAVFERMSYGSRADAVIAVAKRPSCDLSDLKVRQSGPLVVLEAIENPGNIGAVFRSADASGAAGIILADSVSDAFHPNAIRNSMATVFSIPHASASADGAIEWLVENNYKVFVAMPEDAKVAFDCELTGRCAIVFGNEAHGVSAKWQRADFQRACLPMLGIADSLNVSVTAAAMLYESLRQRRSQDQT